MPPQVLVLATFRSKATGLFQPKAECRQRYRELIDDLAGSLNAPEVRREATASLRALISEVRMVPDGAAPVGHQLELVGELAGLMALGQPESKKPPLVARAWSETVVAGAGFEPATFRL